MQLTNSFTLKTGTLEELNSIITQPGFKGTIANLPNELYHNCAGISRSTLSDLEKSYAHFEESRKNRKPPTRAMIFGSAFHDYTMLPEEFERNFAVLPEKKTEMLDTVEQIKNHLSKFIDTTELNKEITSLESALASHEESNSMPHPLEEEIQLIDGEIISLEQKISMAKEDGFETKEDFKTFVKVSKETIKALKAKQKSHKDEIKVFQTKCKEKGTELKDKIKAVRDQIKALESKLSGNKSVLIANLREFDKEVQIWDEIFNAHLATSQGKQVITHEEFSRIKVMAANVKSHPTLSILRNASLIQEQSFFWHDEETGLLCKCRPDQIFVTSKLFLPGDFKTTDEASLREFQRTIGNYEYHIQAAFYLDGINSVLSFNIENFIFVPVETQAPHQLALYALDAPAIGTGRVKYKKHLRTLASYEPGGENYEGWKGYPKEIQNISIPTYLLVEA